MYLEIGGKRHQLLVFKTTQAKFDFLMEMMETQGNWGIIHDAFFDGEKARILLIEETTDSAQSLLSRAGHQVEAALLF